MEKRSDDFPITSHHQTKISPTSPLSDEDTLKAIAHQASALPETRYHASAKYADIVKKKTGIQIDPQQEAEIGAEKATINLEKLQKYHQEHPHETI